MTASERSTVLHDASDFDFEPFVHTFERRSISVAEMLAGTGTNGSATCSCGRWGANVLDNRAGNEAARREFRDHVDAERRERVNQVTEMLLDLDLWQNPLDLQTTLTKASAAIREANVY